MKRFIILMVLAVVCASAVGQDLLVKRNGEQMRVKVLKITKKNVQFVRHGTELPVYTLPISDIEYIQYPMGDRDTFGRKVAEPKAQTEKEPEKWHGPVPTPDGSLSVAVELPANDDASNEMPKRWHGAVPPHVGVANAVITPNNESAKMVYGIGDIYDKDGLKGVVVMLTDGGRHGLIMSLDEVCLAWSNLPRKQLAKVGATDRYNGEANMLVVEKYITEKGLSWSNFPAFEWCRNKGEGWYLPSVNELWSAGTMFLGGSRLATNRRSRKNFNENIESAGGTPLSGVMFYHSSTEDKDARYSLFSHMNSEQPYIQSGDKADDLFVRAFHKF